MPDTLEQILSKIGLSRYLQVFLDAGIDIDILPDLDGRDFRELGVNIGDQKRILRELRPSTPDRGVVERRFLSLLFIDVVGSTEMSVRMDPEDYRRSMFAYQSKCEEILQVSGGHLARKFGDGILAYFGFPQSHENDTRHAAQAALQILDQIPRLPGPVKLELRIGIATGMALVDENPSDDGRERGQVFGETPNLAARLQGLAQPGSIVVCDATQTALSGYFDLTDLGTHALKGLPDPVRAWGLEGAAQTPASFGDTPASKMRPLINRLAEIKVVRKAWARVLAGRGQVVILRGCAGIGKSSLVGHLIDVLDEQSPVTVYWRCDIDQRGRPLHAVAAQIERDIEQRAIFLGGEKDKAKEHWLAEFCPGVDGADAGLASILNAGRSSQEDINSADARATMFALLLSYLDTVQKRHPVKLVIEDLHWIDPTTLEFLEELMAQIGDKRILILGSERDNEPVSFPDYPDLIRVPLEALNAAVSRKILEREFSQIKAPANLKAQIIERCEGIPLYIEEVARAVLEENRRTEGGTLTIPDRASDLAGSDLPTSLLGPLLSRLESRAGARELASVASTIGRRFSVSMLRHLSDMPIGQMRSVLSQLVSAQILHRLDDRDGGQYEFGHSVMQEAAYQVLLKDHRLAAHKTIAETLQTEFAQSVDAKPANIAHHYDASEMWPQARCFWIDAALEMQHFGAHREAVEYCRRALNANDRGHQGDARRDNEIEIRELMFVSQERYIWWSEEYVGNLRRIQELRSERGDLTEQLTVVNGLAGAHLLAGELDEASKLAQHMQTLSHGVAEVPRIFGLRILGICQFYMADFTQSIRFFEQAIELSEQVDKDVLKQYYNADVGLVGRVFVLWAKIKASGGQSQPELEARVRKDLETTDKLSQMYAYCILASCHQSLGDAQGALEFSLRALALSEDDEQTYWHAWATIMNGWALAFVGDGARGIQAIERGIAEYVSAGTKQILPYAKVLLCEALCEVGQKKEAAKLHDDLVGSASSHQLRFVDPMVDALGARL